MINTWINGQFLGRNTWLKWAPAEVAARWEEIDHFAKLRQTDTQYIRQLAYEKNMGGALDSYIIAPIPQRVVRTTANLMLGEKPSISHPDDKDNARLQEILKKNLILRKLKKAVQTSVGEGGVYGVVYIDTRTSRGKQVPLIRFVSERWAVPVFVNDDELIRVTFVTEIRAGSNTVYRIFEQHDPGLITTRLYQGSNTELGAEVSLDARPETAGIVPELQTGVDELLVTYIPNHEVPDSPLGVSDLDGLEDIFLGINEALTLGQDTLRQSVPYTFAKDTLTDGKGNLPYGARVISVNNMESGDDEKPLLETVQPDNRADAFSSYQDFLTDLALMYAGLAPQSLGRQVGGQAESGTARRMMMSHTLTEIAGKAELYQEGLQHLFRMAAHLDQQNFEGKAAVKWNAPDDELTIEFQDGVANDPNELIRQAAQAKAAGLMTTKEGIRYIHPDWDEARVDAEAAEIDERESAEVRRAAESAAGTVPSVRETLDALLSD